VRHACGVSLASQPGRRADAIEVYLRSSGEGALALALTGPDDAGSTLVQRATSGVLRGGLTTWVHVGMLVRRMRGRADPLQGLGHRDTFLALCRLAQAAVEGVPVPGAASDVAAGAHVRLFATPYPAETALPRLQQVLQPYAAAGTLTRTGRAVIAWFAIRHLIAVRSSAYSLQVVHLTPEHGGPCQVSLMLPRTAEERAAAGTGPATAPGPRRLRRRAQRAAEAADRAASAPPVPGPPSAADLDAPTQPRGLPLPSARGQAGTAATARPMHLQAYLDAYREHLTRELLLEPAAGHVAGFVWTPEPTGDGGGVAVGGTVPAAVTGDVVLRMAAQAVAQLGERSPEFAGVPWGVPEPDGDLLVQRWIVGSAGAHVLSVAARSGDRRRPTQVLIHLVAREQPRPEPAAASWSPAPPAPAGPPPALELPYEVPRSGPAADEARALLLLPLWWHSANARCDGNDVILYEMPFRGNKLRIRANDYPAEPMYTLLVGDPGREVAGVDLEDWPPSWTRPRAY